MKVASNLESVGPQRPMAAEAILSAIGNTPLIELDPGKRASPETRLFAKLETVNPGGSIKDRSVARMVTEGIERGLLDGGRRLLDSSSGNAGIAYAQLGAALGIEVTLVIPANASRERLDRIRAHGAEIIETDPIEGYDYAVHTARRMAAERPGLYWYCDQYSNPSNWQAHYDGTGSEVLRQVQTATHSVPDVFLAGVGTGGTLTGVATRLREASPDLLVASVIPEIFPGIEGLKPLGQPDDFVPEILREDLIDRRIDVTLDQAATTARQLAADGLFVGPSSGAYVHAARVLAAEGLGPIITTILSDTGERYSSTGLWSPKAKLSTDSRPQRKGNQP